MFDLYLDHGLVGVAALEHPHEVRQDPGQRDAGPDSGCRVLPGIVLARPVQRTRHSSEEDAIT